MTAKQPTLVLMIADGMGMPRPETGTCAISLANTPLLDGLLRDNPHTQIATSGHHSGLPNAMMGNSEAGHMAIGSGRAVEQIINQVNRGIEQGTFAQLPEINAAIEALKASGGAMHIAGILSDDAGAVHGHKNYLYSMGKVFADAGIDVKLHVMTDGRDCNPGSAAEMLQELIDLVAPLEHVEIATVSGRYFIMDRDKNWNRTEIAFEAVANGINSSKDIELVSGHVLGVCRVQNAIEALAEAQKPEYDALYEEIAGANRANPDEFIVPTVVGDYLGMDASKDGWFMTNHRPDRAVQICAAICDPQFDHDNVQEVGGKETHFVRSKAIKPSAAVGMTAYDPSLNQPQEGHAALMSALFYIPEVKNTLGQVLAAHGLTQLRIAETEKYNHVTKFCNGGVKQKSEGEDWVKIPTPKVSTYADAPAMAAQEVTDEVVKAIENGTYDVVVINLANPDMVGHTGSLDAAIVAMEQVDKNIGQINAALEKVGGVGVLIADHGNAEDMTHPKHTTGPVPCAMMGNKARLKSFHLNEQALDLGLKDVAPTLLHILGIAKPEEMEGEPVFCQKTGK